MIDETNVTEEVVEEIKTVDAEDTTENKAEETVETTDEAVEAAGDEGVTEEDPDHIKRKQCNRTLEFFLDESDYAFKGKKLAELHYDLSEAVAAQDAAKKRHKTRVEVVQQKIDELISVMNAGCENREVEVEEVRDYNQARVQVIYEGKVHETRAMTSDELQMEIDTENKTETTDEDEKVDTIAEEKVEAADDATDEGATVEETDAFGVQDVINEETNRSTKHSAVDGATE